MEIQLINIELITPYANNPRKNSAVDKVATSIKEFGFRQPIVVDEKNVVVVGHTRLQAAKKLGLTQVPVHIATNLSQKQIAAYRLADNRTNQEAEWDDKMLFIELKDIGNMFTGFDAAEIKTLFARNEQYNKDQDDIPDVPASPITKLGDIYQLGNHRLICGDSTNIETYQMLMNKDNADLILTDLPYNVAYDQSKNPSKNKDTLHKVIANDDLNDKEFDNFLYSAFKPAVLHMRAGGAFYCFHADRTRIAFEQAATKAGIKLTVSLVWVKNCLVFSRLDYQPKHEPILYGWKEGAGHYFVPDRTKTSVIDDEPDYSKMLKEDLVNLIKGIKSTVIRCDKPSKSDLHPTMKPVKLMQELMENSTKPEDIVLDMFGGSGSTIIAAEKCNRSARLIELDPSYCDVIVKRWEEFTGKKATNGR